MKNFGQMMKQAQEMQRKLQSMQETLADMEIVGSAGGGLVTVTLNGKGDMRNIGMDPSLLEPAEAAVLEDLVKAAHGDARSKMEACVAEEMAKITGGLNLPPGMGLPF